MKTHPVTLWCKVCGLKTPQVFECEPPENHRRMRTLTMNCLHCDREVTVTKRYGDWNYYSESQTDVLA